MCVHKFGDVGLGERKKAKQSVQETAIVLCTGTGPFIGTRSIPTNQALSCATAVGVSAAGAVVVVASGVAVAGGCVGGSTLSSSCSEYSQSSEINFEYKEYRVRDLPFARCLQIIKDRRKWFEEGAAYVRHHVAGGRGHLS